MMKDLFYSHYTTQEIARELLGCLLVHETEQGRMSGWIVETEAYLGIRDQAAHSYGGRKTKRNEVMYRKPGTIYVYQMHTHAMLNIITQAEGVPEGILIRAIEPFEGIELMLQNRPKKGFLLTNGPGKLTEAMNITMKENGGSIFGSGLFIAEQRRRIPNEVVATPRIGIPDKGEWTHEPLRYVVANNPYVSKWFGKITENHGWKT
jgi:DNA-3-methyladenine glycosylase